MTKQRLAPPHAMVALILIVLASAVLRVYAFRGYGGLDDAEYARFAHLLAEGRPFPDDYTGPAVFPLRVGIITPPALLFRMFGAGEWTMVAYPFLVSLAGILLVYLCAAMFFGYRAGLIAAALLGIFHWDIDSATKLLPDLPAAFWASAGVTLVAFVTGGMTAGRPRLIWSGVLAGIAFGLSWLTKESVAYLVPFTLALMFLTLRRSGPRMWFAWGGVAAGSLAILLGEMLVYRASTGDLLFRLHEVERNYRQWENGFFTEGSSFGWEPGTSYAAALFDRLFVSGPGTILLEPSFYYIPLIALAATLYGWRRRDRSFLVPGLWLWSLVLMFNFGSSSTTSYVPLALFHRYLYLMFLPAIVLVAGLLAKTLLLEADAGTGRSALVLRATGATVLVLILWAAAPHLYFGVVNRPTWWAEEIRALQSTVTPDTPVYADAITLRGFEFFSAYPEKTAWIDFEDLESSDEIRPGSLVMVNDRYLEWLDRNAGMWVAWPAPGPTNPAGYRVHPFYDTPPCGWTRIWQNGNMRVYRVDGHSAQAAGHDRACS